MRLPATRAPLVREKIFTPNGRGFSSRPRRLPFPGAGRFRGVRPLRKLGFLTIGLFEESDPRRGHESTLEIIELGEQLGFDSVWVRHRHLQFGISSPVAGWRPAADPEVRTGT